MTTEVFTSVDIFATLLPFSFIVVKVLIVQRAYTGIYCTLNFNIDINGTCTLKHIINIIIYITHTLISQRYNCKRYNQDNMKATVTLSMNDDVTAAEQFPT